MSKSGLGGMKGLIEVVIYIAILPMMMTMLSTLTDTFTGTSAVLVSSIISIVPFLLIVQVLKKLGI
jgi:hypothetical protein